MNTFTKNLSFAGASLILIALIFSSGYFVGHNNSNYAFSANLDNVEDADLSDFWKVWQLLDEKFIAASSTTDVSNQERVWGAISGLVDSLGDPYTTFFPPEEKKGFEDSLEGNFEGVGMEVGIENEVFTVVAPLKGSPAELAGMMTGDLILEIDGVSTEGMKVEEGVSKIRGPIGTIVTLTIFREGEDEEREIKITRDKIVIPNIKTEIKDDVFVISLYSFGSQSSSEFRKALREFVLSKKSRLMIDLRGNPGGYLDAAVDMASWFIPTGKVIVTEDFGDEKKDFRSDGQNIFNNNLKMVVLVNKGSASASEILAGALQEHGIAKLVGTKTFGKGSVQELVEISPETSLKVTIARWVTPNGTSISDGGLTPDYLIEKVPETAPKDTKLMDYQFEEALKILRGMK